MSFMIPVFISQGYISWILHLVNGCHEVLADDFQAVQIKAGGEVVGAMSFVWSHTFDDSTYFGLSD